MQTYGKYMKVHVMLVLLDFNVELHLVEIEIFTYKSDT